MQGKYFMMPSKPDKYWSRAKNHGGLIIVQIYRLLANLFQELAYAECHGLCQCGTQPEHPSDKRAHPFSLEAHPHPFSPRSRGRRERQCAIILSREMLKFATQLADRRYWFRGSASESNELQALPAQVQRHIDWMNGRTRQSLEGSAFPGRSLGTSVSILAISEKCQIRPKFYQASGTLLSLRDSVGQACRFLHRASPRALVSEGSPAEL